MYLRQIAYFLLFDVPVLARLSWGGRMDTVQLTDTFSSIAEP